MNSYDYLTDPDSWYLLKGFEKDVCWIYFKDWYIIYGSMEDE